MKPRKKSSQVYFDSGDYMKIKALAKLKNISFAEFVRESTLEKLRSANTTKRLSEMKTFKTSNKKKSNVAASINKYLY
jgi:hypothetical protein